MSPADADYQAGLRAVAAALFGSTETEQEGNSPTDPPADEARDFARALFGYDPA